MCWVCKNFYGNFFGFRVNADLLIINAEVNMLPVLFNMSTSDEN
jgi:hypothetical protein